MSDARLDTLAQKLVVLEQKKKSLLDDLDAVQLEIIHVQAMHAFLRNQTLPVARLPPEIMGQIFLIGQRDERDENDKRDCESYYGRSQPRTSKLLFELTVSHTSRHWRDLALATPLLWSRITTWPTARPLAAVLESIATYLARSGTCPLDIDADIVEADLLDLICAPHNVARWRCVRLDTSNGEYDHNHILALIGHVAAPLLERISLWSKWLGTEPFIDCHLFTAGAPALTYVRLGGLMAKPPLQTVTTLILEASGYIPFPWFRDLIAATPWLVNLSLSGVDIDLEPSAQGHPSLNFPSLRSLRICPIESGTELAYQFLSAVHAPNLCSLILAGCSDDEPLPNLSWPALTPFPTLHSLTLIDCVLSHTNFQSLQRALPAITHLSLLGNHSGILERLADEGRCQYRADLPWQALTTLTLEGLDTVQDFVLCRLTLAARKQLGCPIAVLRINKMLQVRLRRRERPGWLEAIVAVETWVHREPWPPGTDVVDLYDTFGN